MATTWIKERRRRQSEMIRKWKPWLKSTGPKTGEGKAKVSRNAYKGGHRKLFRELNRALKEQRRMLEKV